MPFLKLGDINIKGEFASNASVTYREDGANRFTTGGVATASPTPAWECDSIKAQMSGSNGTATSVKKVPDSRLQLTRSCQRGWGGPLMAPISELPAFSRTPLTKGGQEG